jgi:4'-phosphopantetheinyl transferase
MSVIRRVYPGIPPPLASGGVHVWFARLDPCPDGVRDYLTAEERARAEGYKLPRVRDQFIAGRGVLRALLASYLGIRPGEVTIVVDPLGKPVLRGSAALHFNVSHSAGLGLIAVAGVPVGVDLEPVRTVENADDLVERFFAAEECITYETLPPSSKPAGFLRGWTCKEAVLKALGIGMRRMDECAVEMDPAKRARIVRLEGMSTNDWALETWSPSDGFVAAVAYRNTADAAD